MTLDANFLDFLNELPSDMNDDLLPLTEHFSQLLCQFAEVALNKDLHEKKVA